MCNCSNVDLAMWGAGAGAVAYFFNPTPMSVGIGVALGILYRRSSATIGNEQRKQHKPGAGWHW